MRGTRKVERPVDHWVIVVEVSDVVPRKDPSKPNLYVGITIQAPEARLLQLKVGQGPTWTRGIPMSLRTDLMTPPTRHRLVAVKNLKRQVARLSRDGFTVNRDTRVWTVYVIELDPSGVSELGKGYVYVGETSKSPEDRFLQHTTGARTDHGRLYSPVVFKRGLRLRMDLSPKVRYFDSVSAKAAEKKHFERLKRKGYKVEGGH